MAEIDELQDQIAALEATLGGTASMVAAFDGELAKMKDSLVFTGREVGALSSGISGGLRLVQGQLHEAHVFWRMRHGCTMPSLTIHSAKARSSALPCAYAACMATCDSGRCWLSLSLHCSSVMRSSNATMPLSILCW